MEKIWDWLEWHIPNFAMGVIGAASAYFQPIKGIVTITMITILVDMVLGIWAARKRGKGIKSVKLWRTAYKMLISFAVIHLLYSIDQEFGITIAHSYVIAGLFIVGFEMWSILENAAVITDHRIFRILRKYMEDKVKSSTGIDMVGEDNKNKENESDKSE